MMNMKPDQIETMNRSLIQHGKSSDRIYLMHLDSGDFPQVIDDLERLSARWDYGKIFVKVPTWAYPAFLANGYRLEAYVPGFFRGETDGVFLGKFRKAERYDPSIKALEVFQDVLQRPFDPVLPSGYAVSLLDESHIDEMVKIYSEVFPVYPFPIHDADYLGQTMRENVRYFGVFEKERLAGISSMETDLDELNAEMTDFAVLPSQRGKGLANHLLTVMDSSARNEGIRTVYTIARLNSPGMNRTFQKAGYRYGGTLVKNTHISTGIEDMNVWWKQL